MINNLAPGRENFSFIWMKSGFRNSNSLNLVWGIQFFRSWRFEKPKIMSSKRYKSIKKLTAKIINHIARSALLMMVCLMIGLRLVNLVIG